MALRIVLVLACVLVAACEPQDRRPGTWVSGELVLTKVTDWSFANDYPEVFIQTHPWYQIPHSVTVVIAAADGKLYTPSVYVAEPKTFPEGKYWNRIVSRNPDVEVKIGDRLFPRTIRLVTDEQDFANGLNALAEKYPSWQKIRDSPEQAPAFVIMRLDDRG